MSISIRKIMHALAVNCRGVSDNAAPTDAKDTIDSKPAKRPEMESVLRQCLAPGKKKSAQITD